MSQALNNTFKWSRAFSVSTNWYQNEIESYEQYYEQLPSQLKNTIKRKTKKLLNQHIMKISVITDHASFTKYFNEYKRIYQLSWKGEEASFGFIEQVCCDALISDKLRMGMLFIDDKPAAAQIWFVNNGWASIFKLAYDPRYKNFSVGSILSLALSEHVIDKDNVHSIEFGMGNERYKKDWLKKSRQRYSYQLFNTTSLKGKLMAFYYIFFSRLKNRLKATFINYSE